MLNEELERQQIEAFEKAEEVKPIEVVTAFLVMQMPNGQWTAYADLNQSITLQRAATVDDFVAGSENVKTGAIIQQTSLQTMMHMEQRAVQMAKFQAEQQEHARQQAESDRIAAMLDPKHLRSK